MILALACANACNRYAHERLRLQKGLIEGVDDSAQIRHHGDLKTLITYSFKPM